MDYSTVFTTVQAYIITVCVYILLEPLSIEVKEKKKKKLKIFFI